MKAGKLPVLPGGPLDLGKTTGLSSFQRTLATSPYLQTPPVQFLIVSACAVERRAWQMRMYSFTSGARSCPQTLSNVLREVLHGVAHRAIYVFVSKALGRDLSE